MAQHVEACDNLQWFQIQNTLPLLEQESSAANDSNQRFVDCMPNTNLVPQGILLRVHRQVTLTRGRIRNFTYQSPFPCSLVTNHSCMSISMINCPKTHHLNNRNEGALPDKFSQFSVSSVLDLAFRQNHQ